MGCSGSAPAGSAEPALKGEKPLVLVTGITGFIGAPTVKALLDSKRCRVRATMRGVTDEAKLAILREGFGDAFDQIELVEAELLNEEQIRAACEGCEYVLHVAALVQFGVTEEEVIPPSLEGTLNVLKGCTAAKVKRCVYVGSNRSVANPQNLTREDKRYDESNWAESNETYAKAKQLAEKAAWDFVAELPDEDKFELVSILPGCTWGPPTLKTFGVSVSWLTGLMTGTMNPYPREYQPFVDLRDVVSMIMRGMTVPEAAGKRFLSVGRQVWFRDIANILEDKYGLEWPVSKDECEEGEEEEFTFDTTASQTILGIKYIPLEQTIADTVQALIANGSLVKPEPAAGAAE